MREIEVKYGLERVQGSQQTYDRAPTWWEHKLAHEKGRLSPKMEMQTRISTVLEDQPTTTQFINRLREAHGIESIFRLNEDGAPCGIAFRYGETVMSGGSLGRGYTWKKLQERGLTYDERDFEAVKRAGERAGQSRQSIADQERAVDRAAPTISNSGRGAVDDKRSSARIREAAVGYGERQTDGQQHTSRTSAQRGDQPPNQTGFPETEANRISNDGKAPTANYGSPNGDTFMDACGSSQTDPFCINVKSNVPVPANTELLLNPSRMGQSPASAENSPGIEFMEATGFTGPADVSGATNADVHSGARVSKTFSASDPNFLTRGFRDGIREALNDVSNYMQDYWQEEASYQSAIAVDPVELAEEDAEAEVEIEEFIVREAVAEKVEATRAEVTANIKETSEMLDAVGYVAESEKVMRARAGVEMPNPSFREYELRAISNRAMELNNVKTLKEYDALCRVGQAEGLLEEEVLAARAIGRETVAASRVLNAQIRLTGLNKPLGEGLTVRDVTPVKATIEGTERVVTLRDVAAAPEEVQQVVSEAMQAYETSLQAKLDAAQSFYDGARDIADDYRAELAAQGQAAPLPQFSVKEHIELERFAASVEDEALHRRFTQIAAQALSIGRVIGIESAHARQTTQPVSDVAEQAIKEESVAQEVAAQKDAIEMMQPPHAGLNAIYANAQAITDPNAVALKQGTMPSPTATRQALNQAQAIQPPVTTTPPRLPYTVTTQTPPPAAPDALQSTSPLGQELAQSPVRTEAIEATEAAEAVEAEEAIIEILEL